MSGYRDTDMYMPDRLSGCFFGGGSTSSSQQSSTAPVMNPAFPALQANAAHAQTIADQPFQAYSGQLVAPSNSSIDLSSSLYKNIGQNNPGGATLNSAVGNVNALSTPGGLQPFMNPYQKSVTDTTMSDLERQRQIAAVGDTQRAQSASAYGGSRSGVAQSLTNEAAGRTAASTLANLNFGNFDNAQKSALAAASAGGQLSGQQQQQALTSAQAAATGGNQQRTIEQQQLDAAYQEFMRRLNYPIQGQELVNQSYGLLPGGVSNAGTSSGRSSGFNFQIL